VGLGHRQSQRWMGWLSNNPRCLRFWAFYNHTEYLTGFEAVEKQQLHGT
jgi:hypothetical protein